MEDDIEQRVIALARRHNGVYLFNNEKKQRLLTPTTDLDTDMRLDGKRHIQTVLTFMQK